MSEYSNGTASAAGPTSEAPGSVGGIREQIGEAASRARSKVDSARQPVADKLHDAAGTVRARASGAADRAADTLEASADYLESRNARRILQDLRRRDQKASRAIARHRWRSRLPGRARIPQQRLRLPTAAGAPARPGRTRSFTTSVRGLNMLYYTIVFLVIALIAGAFGFFGIAGTAAGIAKILFIVFLVLFVLSLIFGRRRVP